MKKIDDATRMLLFVSPDRAPSGPIQVEPTFPSGPPFTRPDGDPEMTPQHHVHPTDDEASRQDKG
ncbi:MAG: hypothetical protein EXR68_04605 [Dehalococcoidia bacterium]|nr:hypothetical protein [Dehalococcoidia bacterium]